MGAGASMREERKGPPKTLISKLDGETRAFDLMKLMDEDTVEAAWESKQRLVLDELERAQANAMVQLTTRHVAEVDALVALHKAQIDALYKEVPGLVTPGAMQFAGPAHHAHAKAQKLLWRSRHHPAPGRVTRSPPPSAVSGRLPQSRQQLRLAEMGTVITSLAPGRAAGMQSGLRTLAALDAVHQNELEELEATQQQEIAAAQMHGRYERTAALYKMDCLSVGNSEEDKSDAEEDVDDELVRLADEICLEGTAISDVDQGGRAFCEMNRGWSEIEDATLTKWKRSTSPLARRGRSPSPMRCCRPGRCRAGANGEDSFVESLVVRAMAVEDVRPCLEPNLPEEVKWTDIESFLMEDNDPPDVEAATANPTEYAQNLCTKMLDKQLALQDVS